MASASADAPLCALAPDFARRATQSDAAFGAAVYDLRTGTVWSGGLPGPYALHSAVKTPVAWAVMTDAYEHERELTKLQRDAIFYMVAWSQNPDVVTLLGMIGGLEGLNRYYERIGVPQLVELQHANRWGSGRASPSDLAHLYAALAVSPEVPEPVRGEGLNLLRAVIEQHRWGASIPERRLVGWESLIKTGNFTLPEPAEPEPADEAPANGLESDEPYASATEQARGAKMQSGDVNDGAPWYDHDEDDGPVIRMNSAAIWLNAPWSGSEPRFVIAIMQETQLGWSASRALQNEIGATLAHAVAGRVTGHPHSIQPHCLKRSLY